MPSHNGSFWIFQPGAQGCKELPDLFNSSFGTEDFINYSTFHEYSEHILKIKLFLILIISLFLNHFQNFPPPSIGNPFPTDQMVFVGSPTRVCECSPSLLALICCSRRKKEQCCLHSQETVLSRSFKGQFE